MGSAGVVWAVAAALPQGPASLPNADADQAAFFETKVRPVFATNCYPCHGQATQMANFRLDSQAAFQKGGDSGPEVVPGNPDKSRLIQAIRQTGSLKMPPAGKHLTNAEIADIAAWIKMGAPWPAPGSTKTASPLSWWSLQPVKNPPTPNVKGRAWVRNSIDTFVLANLEAHHLSPAPPADRRTLIRRVTYDLIGLPPTEAEVEAYIKDRSPDAYEKVVDRLLASPRYGERWARHWMDVARYADTKGYVFNEDRNYPNAYTYRDWLIDAFNRDLPYDKFIVEQLAADRMPEVQSGEDERPLAALGFLTLGRRFINSVPDIIDDRIDVTMRGFEGFTVECARCHDHKFDPIPTQDYYSLYAIFNSSEEASLPISDRSIRDPWNRFNAQVNENETAIRTVVADQTKLLRQKAADPEAAKSLTPIVKQVLQSIREEVLPEGGDLQKLLPAFDSTARDQIITRQKTLDDLKKHAPPTPEFAMAMKDRPTCSDGYVFKRGNPANHGDPAPRRFLLALSKAGADRPHWTDGSGRLELAESIASRSNPLTARVFVNRVWQDHFGAGIVRTPSDFGHQGDKPTDPALLDRLATAFMSNGWSIKELQRLIVSSATYRQSSAVTKKTYDVDQDNRYWSRMNRRRLDLEQTRDSMVAAAGKLDVSRVGGKSVDLWSKPFTQRRAVYGFIERQNLPGIFRTFDFASPDSHSAKRFQTTVPQQALFFMNSDFAVEMATSLVDRPEIKGALDDAKRVRRLYLDLFQRLPNSDEASIGVAYLMGASGPMSVSRLALYAQALMMTNEFVFID